MNPLPTMNPDEIATIKRALNTEIANARAALEEIRTRPPTSVNLVAIRHNERARDNALAVSDLITKHELEQQRPTPIDLDDHTPAEAIAALSRLGEGNLFTDLDNNLAFYPTTPNATT